LWGVTDSAGRLVRETVWRQGYVRKSGGEPPHSKDAPRSTVRSERAASEELRLLAGCRQQGSGEWASNQEAALGWGMHGKWQLARSGRTCYKGVTARNAET